MSEQIFNTPALIFDEANGRYEPRLARMAARGWNLGVSKRELILMRCAAYTGCEYSHCRYNFPKCIWTDEYYEDVQWAFDKIERNGVTGPDGVHYDIHLDGGLFLIPPGWSWVDHLMGYVPDHCEDCHRFQDCEIDEPDIRLGCRVYEKGDK